ARRTGRIAAWGDADEPLEVARKVALIAETRVLGNPQQRQTRGQKYLCPTNAQLREVSMRGETGLALEDTQQMEGAQIREARQLVEVNVVFEVRFKVAACKRNAPWLAPDRARLWALGRVARQQAREGRKQLRLALECGI